MEACVQLVCESLGVCEDGEVRVEEVCLLYQNVFLLPATLNDTQKAVTQVSARNGGMPCSGRWILHVLLVMERERESMEELYWEQQMLKAGRTYTASGRNTRHQKFNSKLKKIQDATQQNIASLLRKARRHYMRLDLDGVWSVLPSLSHTDVVARRQGWIKPSSLDILQLLQYKYDIIKERLYREMLQEEYGVSWWESLTSHEQMDCLCELGGAAEQALKRMDMLRLCQLPGALRSYSNGQVVLQACAEVVKARDQAWSSKPREQAWSAAVFYTELESLYQEERNTLTVLLNRVDRAVLREMYMSVCVAVRRAEREMCSYTALLAARQHWDKWPFTRGLVSQELVKLWLQGNPNKRFQQDRRSAGCTLQALLQSLVLCQEQERQSLLEILHTLTLDELHDQSYTQPPSYTTAERNAAALRQACVFSLRQIKVSLHGKQDSGAESFAPHHSVSWADCAVHLLTQLTLAQEDETWTVLHTLPDMDAPGLVALLQKYESELKTPKLHHLHALVHPHVQTHTSGDTTAADAVTSPDSERDEQREDSQEMQEICTGCGVVLVPEDAPYLEILGARNQRDEETTEEREERKDERGGRRKNERQKGCGEMEQVAGKMTEFEREERKEQSEERRDKVREERMVGSWVERDQGREKREVAVEIDLEREGSCEKCELEREERKEGAGERREGSEVSTKGKEEKRDGSAIAIGGVEEVSLEKQGSLITLAWSRKAEGQVTSALQEEETALKKVKVEISANSNTQDNQQNTHEDTSHHEEQTLTHLYQPNAEMHHTQSVHTDPAEELTLVHSLPDKNSTTNMDVQRGESSHVTNPPALELNSENKQAIDRTQTCEDTGTKGACGEQEQGHEPTCEEEGGEEECEEVCVDSCEELQLQREATMRSLVHMQRRAELRWQRGRDRQLLRVQERLSIIQNRKSDEDLLGLTQEDTFKHLTSSLLQEDEQHQKTLVREKLQQLRRERSYVLQSRRERNTAGFKELLAPTAQHMTNTEDGL